MNSVTNSTFFGEKSLKFYDIFLGLMKIRLGLLALIYVP